MKKGLLTAVLAIGLLFGGFSAAVAVNCGNAYPTALNNYYTGCTIPSSWANSLEQYIGVVGSTVTSSLTYQINHISAVTSVNNVKTTALVVSGTANEVNVSLSTTTTSTTLTLSLPQPLNTGSTPTFGGAIFNGNVTGTTETMGTSTITSLFVTNFTDYGVTSSIPVANASGAFSAFGGATCTGAQVIQSLSPTGTPVCMTVATSSGGQAAAPKNSIQYNGGANTFAGSSGITVVAPTSSQPGVSIGNKQGNYQTSTGGMFFSTSTTQTFSYTGATSTYTGFTIPSNATTVIHTFVIHAVGGHGGPSSSGGIGGAAGVATGTYTNNATGTLTLTLLVGQQGADDRTTSTFGGGGSAYPIGRDSGSGGGFSGVFSSSTLSTSTAIIIAAGGGGADTNPGIPSSANGGDAGYPTGQSGQGSSCPGTGGSQTSGGTTGGSALQGANGSQSQQGNGPGGGGGFYGGGSNGTCLPSPAGGGSDYFLAGMTSTSTATSSALTDGSLTITETVSYWMNASPTITTSTPSQPDGLYVQGHVFYAASTTPSLSSCGGINTSTAPTISGSDESFKVVPGTGNPTSCTVNFITPFNHANCALPVVVGASNNNGGYVSALSTTSVTFGFSTSPSSFYGRCDDY